MSPTVWLFAATVFASAFLIFGVQPMVGKHILPWFGGAPAVWMICLAFYQTTLFLGYAYAYWLAGRVSQAAQPLVHALVFLASLAVLPVLPGDAWKPEPASDSTGLILGMLAVNVALPFMLLASTGPLLQVWFARALPARSPYALYAVSNLGSLLGLVTFPFLVEPRMALSLQSQAWSWSFAATGVAILCCAGWAARLAPGPARAGDAGASPAADPIHASRVGLWILLPASSVVMFMGVTNHLCLDVASVPFLWIVPLSIYLITLVLCFGSERLYRRGVFALLGLASLGALTWTTLGKFAPTSGLAISGSVAEVIGFYFAALFFGCMIAHGELYRLRPGPARLTSFYLCVAGGGALGGLFVGIVAPRIFLGYHELPIGVALCWLLALAAVRLSPTGVFAGRLRGVAWASVVLVTIGAFASYAVSASRVEPGTLAVERNFFGILRVIEKNARPPFVVLRHGTTRHGLQYRNPPARSKPTSYYGIATAVGLMLGDRMREGAAPIEMGVVGLGIGTLAAYGRDGDRIVFYEIDPDVVHIARDSGTFSYLADSRADTEIVVGDARLSLESELSTSGSRGFDLLVVDAFSSDAVPLHLLTREAFLLYDAHLREGGVLAIHASNRNFDLTTQVGRLGEAVGLSVSVVLSQSAPRRYSDPARWLILSRDPGYFDVLSAAAERLGGLPGKPLAVVLRPDPATVAQAPLWTDDFSNVFSLLRGSGDP